MWKELKQWPILFIFVYEKVGDMDESLGEKIFEGNLDDAKTIDQGKITGREALRQVDTIWN